MLSKDNHHERKNILWLVPCLLAGAFTLLAVKVSTDYNHSADFSRYRTYSWMEVKADPLWVDRVRTAVDKELVNKGWTQVPSGGDASVAAFGSTKEVPRLETYYQTFGGGWYWHDFGNGTSTTTVENIPVGTLVVDIFDSHTKKLIWRSVATDTVSHKPEKNEKKLDNAVDEMFEHFPPKSKG